MPEEISITSDISAISAMQMAENEEELETLLKKVQDEREKAGLKLNIQKSKITASSPITSWQIDGETKQTVTDFIFVGSKNHCSYHLQ